MKKKTKNILFSLPKKETQKGKKKAFTKTKRIMDTSLFGVLWTMLHFYAFYLPETALSKEMVATFAKFVEYFVTMVPCGGCVYHASRYFLENQKALHECTTGRQIFAWTVTFHNDVNIRLGRRTFTTMEAESALLMHLTGRSPEQQRIEDENTKAKRKIKKLKDKLLMLNNKSHLIEPTSTDARLTQMFAHKKLPDSGFELKNCVFRAFLLLALEYHFEKPVQHHIARNAQELLRFACELFPDRRISCLSVAFYQDHKPNFVQASDIFDFTIQWYNAVNTPIAKQAIIDELRRWASNVYKRQGEIRDNKRKDEAMIRALQTEYNTFFKKKQEFDADRIKKQPKTQTISQSAAEISCVVLLITILLTMFVGLSISLRKTKIKKSVL